MSELTDEERAYLGEPKPEPKPAPKPEHLSTKQPKPYQNVSQPTEIVENAPVTAQAVPTSVATGQGKDPASYDKYATAAFAMTAIPICVFGLLIMTQNIPLIIILGLIYIPTAIPLAVMSIIFGIIGLKSNKRALAIITLIPYALIILGFLSTQAHSFLTF